MKLPRRRYVIALLIVVLAWVAWRATRSPDEMAGGVPQADSMSTGFRAARVYFAAANGDGLVAETVDELETPDFHDRVAELVDALEKGPRARGIATLPHGTSVLHAYLDDRGLLTLDLSPAFRDGFRGGSSAEFLATASITRTIAANLPEVKRIILVCGGEPLATLGGHLPLDRPIDVANLP